MEVVWFVLIDVIEKTLVVTYISHRYKVKRILTLRSTKVPLQYFVHVSVRRRSFLAVHRKQGIYLPHCHWIIYYPQCSANKDIPQKILRTLPVTLVDGRFYFVLLGVCGNWYCSNACTCDWKLAAMDFQLVPFIFFRYKCNTAGTSDDFLSLPMK